MLEELKRSVFAGKTTERPWEIFRRAQFPTMDDDQAKDALLEWGEENQIEVTLFTRKVNEWDVLYVMFDMSPLTPSSAPRKRTSRKRYFFFSGARSF